jgi:hypothetical protein
MRKKPTKSLAEAGLSHCLVWESYCALASSMSPNALAQG